MSGKVSGLVWDLDLPQREKFVLLAYADHSDHTGFNIFPSVGLIAWKTGYSKRTIQRITKSLVDKNLLIPDGTSERRTNRYRIDVQILPVRPPYIGGDIAMSPIGGEGDKTASEGDKAVSQKDDIQVSPEPSLSRQNKTASRNGDIFEFYESNITKLTPFIREEIIELINEYPVDWIMEAMKIAVANNARKLNYFRSILERWEREGKDNGKSGIDKQLRKAGYNVRS